ncbi:MAG: FHA domain-containing protein [Muribaculaceae bacterium]|nr:FHA domain-containing protein [Muribaculaceae bacterium]
MKTITLGRDGDQPFKIKGIGVSHIHATVTIDDFGRWTLADNNSANGTYVRDEVTGDLIRVSDKGQTISQMSFVVLGSDTAAGCSFYANQLTNPGNFVNEYLYMRNKKLEFDKEEEKVARNAKWVRLSIFILMLLFTVGSIIYQIFDDSHESMNVMLWGFRGLSLLTTGAMTFYDAQGKRSKIIKKRNKFNQCPNPECHRKLSGGEIDNLICGRCQKL